MLFKHQMSGSFKILQTQIKNTVFPFIKGKSNLSCQPHFLHSFRKNFPYGFAGEIFYEKECGGNSNSI